MEHRWEPPRFPSGAPFSEARASTSTGHFCPRGPHILGALQSPRDWEVGHTDRELFLIETISLSAVLGERGWGSREKFLTAFVLKTWGGGQQTQGEDKLKPFPGCGRLHKASPVRAETAPVLRPSGEGQASTTGAHRHSVIQAPKGMQSDAHWAQAEWKQPQRPRPA